MHPVSQVSAVCRNEIFINDIVQNCSFFCVALCDNAFAAMLFFAYKLELSALVGQEKEDSTHRIFTLKKLSAEPTVQISKERKTSPETSPASFASSQFPCAAAASLPIPAFQN